ncbi:YjbH domain-containing protein [Roseivivax sp. CAU 1753]
MKRVIGSAAIAFVASGAFAEPVFETGYNTYGMPGMVDMPNALSFPDAELGATVSYFGGQSRTTGAFQILPRLTGAFRYASIDNYRGGDTYYDRSFSIHYQLMQEGDGRPALAIGVNDLFGTGLYASEYLVATKHVTPHLRFTGGLGWGRLGQVNGFRNPLSVFGNAFETRPARTVDLGGEAELDQLFRGDAAFFGGVEYQATDKLSFTLEYSSDEYNFEDGPTFDYESPFNLGMTYRVTDNASLSASYLYGSAIGVQLTYATNPKEPGSYGGGDVAPYPVTPRGDVDVEGLGWRLPDNGAAAIGQLRTVMAADGINLHGFRIDRNVARVEIESTRWRTAAQAVGRTSRILTASMPPVVDTFVIVPVTRGIPASEVTIRRDDMEELAYDLDNSWSSYARARIDAATAPLMPLADLYPRYDYKFRPYAVPSLFDPDDPLRFDVGVELSARAEPVSGLLFQGAVRQKVFGTLDQSTRVSNSVLPKVRSETNIFQKNADTYLNHLTGSYFFKPGRDLYGRMTVGYLESQYGGVSGEVLWKPVDSNLALGVEANYVKQRSFEQGFGFQDYEIATGHASVYYQFANGFEAQVDAGRYLAGDWGATFTLERTFKNGWRVGAFATLTDVPFDEFGEGSFDKGLIITVPFDWIRGSPTRDEFSYTLRPILRDGGARVNVRDRLYELVRDNHRPDMQDSWGRFWK